MISIRLMLIMLFAFYFISIHIHAASQEELNKALCAIRIHINDNNLVAIKDLVERGAYIDAYNSRKMTLLHKAALYKCEDVLRYCLALKANVHAKDSLGWTPLHYACTGNNIALVEILLVEAGADEMAQDILGQTPLDIAKDRKCSAVVKYFNNWNGFLPIR